MLIICCHDQNWQSISGKFSSWTMNIISAFFVNFIMHWVSILEWWWRLNHYHTNWLQVFAQQSPHQVRFLTLRKTFLWFVFLLDILEVHFKCYNVRHVLWAFHRSFINKIVSMCLKILLVLKAAVKLRIVTYIIRLQDSKTILLWAKHLTDLIFKSSLSSSLRIQLSAVKMFVC